MKIRRILKHLVTTNAAVKRAFPRRTLRVIEKAIAASEVAHAGQVRFAVEDALDGPALFRDQSARERAIAVFAQLHVWDTEHNNGLLIYVLLADRAVEIVADRGIDAKVKGDDWRVVCQEIEGAFRQADFERGVVRGVQRVTEHLARHFPPERRGPNELSDKPVFL